MVYLVSEVEDENSFMAKNVEIRVMDKMELEM